MPDVRVRPVARAPPDLPTTHEDPDLSRTFLLGGGAQSRAHLTHTRKAHALRPAHLCSAPWSRARDARRHLGTRDSFRGAPLSSPFPRQEWSGACRGSQPVHILRHPSLPPSAAAPVFAATSPEPVRRQRGEGEKARDELRKGVGGPEPDEDAPGTGTRAGAGARTKPPQQTTKPRKRPGPRSPPRASCRNHSLAWSRPNMGCTCSSCLCWSSSSWAL